MQIYVDAKDIQPKQINIVEAKLKIGKEPSALTEEQVRLLNKLFPEGIELSNFRQQNTGNCYLLSFLHSFKKTSNRTFFDH